MIKIKECVWDEIESIEPCGEEDCYDIGVVENDFYLDEPNYIAEGFVVHNSNLHQIYCKRKRGEAYEIHPLLKPILENTYGIYCFQEQIMKIFNIIGGFPLPQCYKLVKAISKKKGEIFEKARVQFLEECQKRLEYSKDEAEEFFESISKFSGYAFNLSHSTSYNFLSMRLLYLKAHYPLEFFAAILSCEKDQDKINEYKLEAERFGIKINRLDLNKSKVHFSIIDNEIYLGFADIKGIGDAAAQQIVEKQPYSSFEDFLERFGTNADVLKPLIALRVFKEDPLVLSEFVDHYRNAIKSRKDRDKRYVESQAKRFANIKDLTIEEIDEDFCLKFQYDENLSAVKRKALFMENSALFLDAASAWKDINQFNKSKKNQLEKLAEDKPIKLADFEPVGEVDEGVRALLSQHISVAENRYCGFPWEYIITQSPDYLGFTFEKFDTSSEERDVTTTCVEVQVIEKPKTVKGKKVTFHRVKVMDGDGRVEVITIWKEDFERFAEEFNWIDPIAEWGNLLKIRLKRPIGNWKSYTFESCPRELRYQLIPKKKEDDYRLVVMRWPEVKKDVFDEIVKYL